MKRSGALKRKSPLLRTGIRRGQPPSRSAGLRPVSRKRAVENRVRAEVKRRLVDVRGPWCEARLDGCGGLAVDAHELLARSAGGSIVDEENIALVCRPCHDWIGANPREATVLGLRRSRWGGAA